MHAAPSVRYPVARSPAAGWLLAAAWTAGALAAGWWTWQASAPDWRQGGALILSLATGVVGLLAWRHAPAGALAWDGATWTLQQHSGEAATGRIEPGLDLQWLLLLRWRPEAGRPVWLWLERAQARDTWDALRRAVYSRARTDALQGAQAPGSAP